MLPSKISPTISPSLLNTGEPELPPMMSLVVQKSSGVERSSLVLAGEDQLSGSLNGSRPVARSKAPPHRVIGSTWRPSSSQPFTAPYESRSVKVASG